MSFINWGSETPAQLEARLRAEREWQVLVEQTLNLRRQQSKSTSATPVGAVGGGSVGGGSVDPTANQYVENDYVENDYVENYLQ